MHKSLILFAALLFANPANANDWEKFYTQLAPEGTLLPSEAKPETIPSSGDLDRDIELMARRGYALMGYTSFTTGNSKTKDAERLGKKLRARYLILGVNLTSTSTAMIPLTLPNSTTSSSTGTVSAYGTGGYTNGTYSGTTTTTGTQTTYFPMAVNRYEKSALYFAEVPKVGAGIFLRDLGPDEVAKLETRRAIAVRFVRDNSPAYFADILPGDIITHVNGVPADDNSWWEAVASKEPIKLRIMRNWNERELTLVIPDDWRPEI